MFGGSGLGQPDLLASLQSLSALSNLGNTLTPSKPSMATATFQPQPTATAMFNPVLPSDSSPQLAGFMSWLQAFSANQSGQAQQAAPAAAGGPSFPGLSTVPTATAALEVPSQSEVSKEGTNAGESKDVVNKVHRRLVQNRESARKCRQRKKAYLQELEEELKALRKQQEQAKSDKLQAVTAGLATGTSAVGAEAIAALLEWQDSWKETLLRLSRVLNTTPTSDQVADVVAVCIQHLVRKRTLFQDLVKKDVFAAIAGDHMPSQQRLMLWVGGERPSTMLQLMIQRLQDAQLAQDGKLLEDLARLKASWNTLEEALAMGFDTIKQQLMLSLEPVIKDGAPNPQILGKVDALRVMLNRAEELRGDCWAELERLLPLMAFATALTAPVLVQERLLTLQDITRNDA